MYGWTSYGGISNKGEVFRLDTNGNNFTILHEFVGTDGRIPFSGPPVVVGRSLYGMTSEGGVSNWGVIFMISNAVPSAVRLTNIFLEETAGSWQVCWQTASETDTLGFDLLREDQGAWVKVDAAMMPAQGWPNGGIGADYCVADAGASPDGLGRYKLVEFEIDGDQLEYGPYWVVPRTALLNRCAVTPGGVVLQWSSQMGESYLVFGRNRTPGVTPASGNQAGGYPVVISGQNLGNSVDNTNVTLCGVAATIDSQTVSRVWVTADAAGGGMTGGPVRVFSASYGETVQSNAFTYEGPTLASVQEVRVMMAGGRAQICWATAAEIQTLGFNLYRREDPAGLWVKMNANLIPAEGWPQGGHGANYCFDDPGMAPEPAAQYLIEEIETSGRVVSHGPYPVAAPELRLSALARAQALTIQWPSRGGAVYDLYWTPSLLMPFALLARDMPATPPLNSYTGRLDQAPSGFYLLRAR